MARRTPFAWRNLTHRKVRALVALSGVCFSVLLVFMQVGFYAAVLTAATAVYRRMDCDIFLTSPAYVHLARTGTIPKDRIFQARGVNGVQQTTAVYVDTPLWRNPETRLRYPVLMLGFDPEADLLGVSGGLAEWLENGGVLIDSLSRPQYGTQATGTVTEIADQRVEIAGQYRIGPGFATDGAVITGDDTFIRIAHVSIERPSLAAIRTMPGADIHNIAAGLRKILPLDTEVFTREEMIRREEDYWATQTSIGPVFSAGVALGFVIGIVILYQVMSTDITNHIREYATLKALGYGPRRLQVIVLQEVSAFSAVGFAAGWAASALLYKAVRDATGLPMAMPPLRTAILFVVTVVMCWIAGILAARKLQKANPAELF